MERRNFLKNLFGVAAALIVAPRILAEFDEQPKMELLDPQPEPLIPNAPYGLGLMEQIERSGEHYTYAIHTGTRGVELFEKALANYGKSENRVPIIFGPNFIKNKNRFHK